MTLLTSPESHAFQSFLSSIDHLSHPSTEWNMYASSSTDVLDDDPVADRSKEALTKATKDLMALDTSSSFTPVPQLQYPRYEYEPVPPQPFHHHNTFPFLRQSQSQFPTRQSSYQNTHLQPQQHPHTASSTVPQHRPPPPSAPSAKRNHDHIQPPPTPSTSTYKRQRPTPSVTAHFAYPNPPPDQPPATNPNPTKPALLSPSQKKANHIQSEQKRRANIRRGYEALCATVPALVEAIREEEASVPVPDDVTGKARGKKGRGKGRDGEKVDGRAGPRSEGVVLVKTIEYINDLLAERQALLARLAYARTRIPPDHPLLRRPRSQPDAAHHYPADQDHSPPLWEREWKGGDGRLVGFGAVDGEGEDEGSESEGEGESE